MHMRNGQRGVTAIGWMTILGLIAFFTLMGLKIGPLYMEFGTVSTAMDNVAQNMQGDERASKAQFKKLLLNQLMVNNVNSVTPENLVFKRLKGGAMAVSLDYEARAKLFNNLSVVATFSKSVTVGGGGN